MTASSGLSTRSGHVFYPKERLEGVAVGLRAGAHLSICGLPGTGKSAFVRQLISLEARKQLGLGQDYLMLLLDGQKFAHLPFEQIWGAIVTALGRARSGLSVVCNEQDSHEISYDDLKEALRSFKNRKLILILDNCSDLHRGREESVCGHLLRLSKRYSPTLIVVPQASSSTHSCIPEVRDQFVPINLTLSPEQARQFLVKALSQLAMPVTMKNELCHKVVDWAGGNLSLLDCACHWSMKLRENPLDVTTRWLSRKGSGSLFHRRKRAEEVAWQLLRGMSLKKCSDVGGRRAFLTFRHIVYEMSLREARQLFDRWLKMLSGREQMILLAMDELQRLTWRWQSEIGELSSKGFVQRQGERYLIRPTMFNDYVSRQPTVCNAGPFRLDLNDLQTVHVNDTRCKLSPGQACVFLRLFLQRDDMVPHGQIYADLYAPDGYIADGIMREVVPSSVADIEVELDELRRLLKVSKEIQRVPPRDELPLRGYRLVVPPEGQGS